MTEFRREIDSLGVVQVPADKLWGAQTQRSLEHFSIGQDLIPREMITAYATLKKAAANANHSGGRLDDSAHRLIVQVCDEILASKHHDMFPLHVWMTGSGTQFNMNVNEVISNRCCQLAGTALGSKAPVHPNDRVNMSQSSNDSFPSAMYIAAAVNVTARLLPAVSRTRDAIAAKAAEWKDIVKIGRTHMQDATPITLGQEWSGYAGMLSDDIERMEDALKGVYRLALGGTRKGHVKEVLRNWPVKDVRFICVTDGGRILGLGDLGANGMGIPIGKLELYTACAGVPPQYLLPMYLDAGTNNEQYLRDPLYLGMRKTRPSSEELYSFVDEFVEAVQEVFPKCCIHFEDWTGTDDVHLLERYRDEYCVYNDDVQGTAGITLAGMINAAKLKGTKLKDEKYLFLGAGSAGIGLANLLCSALVGQGTSLKEAQSRVYMFDINGLLEASRKDLVDFQKPYAHQHASTRDFVAAIESIKPTTIIGVSTIGGAFTQKVIESMSRINERPVILALSNPTEHAECTAEQAYTWSKG